MKKVFIYMVMMTAFAACGGGSDNGGGDVINEVFNDIFNDGYGYNNCQSKLYRCRQNGNNHRQKR